MKRDFNVVLHQKIRYIRRHLGVSKSTFPKKEIARPGGGAGGGAAETSGEPTRNAADNFKDTTRIII